MPPAYRGALRFDNLIDLNFSFKPTMAMSAKQFDKLGMDIRSFRVPLKRSIQRVIAPSFDKNFRANGRPETWQPYAEDTIRMKARDPKNKYGPENILRRSGLLWRTMQQYNIWTVTTTQAAILDLPSKIWYGVMHQGGYGVSARAPGHFASPAELKQLGGRGKVSIPARPFALFQDPKDLDDIQEVFGRWIEERATYNLNVKSWTSRGA
jgi:phage gpG-like protein